MNNEMVFNQTFGESVSERVFENIRDLPKLSTQFSDSFNGTRVLLRGNVHMME